ncbi:Helicase conserved C-terminal domain [Popillia japonica]|uniref:RNA helicase n=1 Tax=Popillia japonica TaxID=7064 RepID=A0AAW1IU35_POPJA
MGFGEQLNEIVNRLPDSRQTVLFSATLPKILVDFAKAGLNDPVLIRLDVESKLPSELQLYFIAVRHEERLAALLVLLRNYIESKQQTVVFAATKHHVEYLHCVLDHLKISNTYIYSNLDPSARKINAAKFSQGKVSVLIVTDVAARGIDIPQLDNVINFNFPAKAKLFVHRVAKLFVHRVGRCARAGRSGTAYSLQLIAMDEYAHLLDLHLFLGKPLTVITATNSDGIVGRIPQSLVEEQHEMLLGLHDLHLDLVSLKDVSEKGYQQYCRSRPAASTDSNKRVKDMGFSSCGVHPLLRNNSKDIECQKENMLDQMRQYRPHGTIFEICGKTKSQDYIAMKTKRAFHKDQIAAHHQKLQQTLQDVLETTSNKTHLPDSNNDIIESTFKEIILPKKRKIDDLYKKKVKKIRDEEHYVPYLPSDKHTEEGLAVNNFNQEATKVQFDITGDSEEMIKTAKQIKKWDRKKKKMVTVNVGSKEGKIKTESGVWISATFKSNRYNQWKERTKAAENEADSDDDTNNNKNEDMFKGRPNTHWARHNDKIKLKQRRSELKSNEQILKQRIIAEKKKKKQKGKRKQHRKRK